MEDSEHIVMTSLLEEQEELQGILIDWVNSAGPTIHLEKEITRWANDLLRNAANNEPGQVNLLPGPDPERDRLRKQAMKEESPEDPQGEHQSLGGGSSRIVQNGPHQKLS